MDNKANLAIGAFLIIVIISYFMFKPKNTSINTSEVDLDMQTNDNTQVKSANTANPQESDFVQKVYQVVLKTTEGDITLELNGETTPKTVKNFIDLAKKNFYNNTIFHRAIKGFMIQGGDPKGDGTGGPGYRFDDEPFEGEYTRGTVAMANAGPNTNGSQFFIMHQDNSLPKNYVIFGKVIEGMDTVDKIAEAPVEMNSSGEMSKPVNPVKIISVEVEE